MADTPEAKAFRAAALHGCRDGRAIGAQLDNGAPPPEFACSLYPLYGWRAPKKGLWQWLLRNAHLADFLAAAKAKHANQDPPPAKASPRLWMQSAQAFFVVVVLPIIGLSSSVIEIYNYSGSFASAEEQADWDALKPGDCDGLRAFIAAHQDGAYRDKAQALLDARRSVSGEEWPSKALDHPLYLPHRAGGKAAMAAAAEQEGQRACTALLQGMEIRDLTVTISLLRQNCEPVDNAMLCDWRGTAHCKFKERVEIATEQCAAPQ